MKNLIVVLICIFMMLDSALVCALDVGEVIEMADSMRESGKIYVVVAVLSIIFLGLAIFLFTIDRRIRNIEKNTRREQ